MLHKSVEMFLKFNSERDLTNLKLIGKNLKPEYQKELIKLENKPDPPG